MLSCFFNLLSPFVDREPPENIPPKESDYFEPNEKIKQSRGYKCIIRNKERLEDEFPCTTDGFGVYFVRKDGKVRKPTAYENYMSGVDE